MKNLSKTPLFLSRRNFTITLLSTFLTTDHAYCENINELNQIIKSLAPIRGQTISQGYSSHNRKELFIDNRRLLIDPDRHVDIEVYFDYNSDVITPRAKKQLIPLGRALSSPELSNNSYLVAGHTDAVGDDDFNLDLSRRRAASVSRFLIETYPIDPNRLIVTGFGWHKLKNSRNPKAAINRRVEIVLIIN